MILRSSQLSNVREVESTESGSVDPVPEAQSEVVTDEPEIQPSSETLSSLSSQSINTICLTGVSLVILAAASAGFYMKKTKSMATKPVNVRFTDDDMCNELCSAESSGVQKGYKKKSGYNKRELYLLASSSIVLSMDSPSYGSFTTYERIPIKHGGEVLMTLIRRSPPAAASFSSLKRSLVAFTISKILFQLIIIPSAIIFCSSALVACNKHSLINSNFHPVSVSSSTVLKGDSSGNTSRNGQLVGHLMVTNQTFRCCI